MERTSVKRLCFIFLCAIALDAQAQTTFDAQVTAAKQGIALEGPLLDSLLAALKTAQAAAASAQAQLASVNATAALLQQQLGTSQAQNTTLTQQLTAAQTQAAADAQTIAGLNAQIASLKAQIAGFSCPAPGVCPVCPICPAPVVCPLPTVCPAPPPPPVVVPPPPTVDTNAILAWDVVTGATGYRIYYGTASGVYNQARGAGLSTTATTFTVGPLASGFTYFFVVTAQNAQAESAFSNEVSKVIGTPAPPAPPPAFTESPTGTKVFVVGTDKIIDSKGAVWTLGPKTPAVENGMETTVLRNGVVKGTAVFLCYANSRQIAAFSAGTATQANWYLFNDAVNFFQILSPAFPAGCA